MDLEHARRLAVVDCGSNSFRLVVFGYEPGGWWKRTDEIYDGVRVGEGLEEAGKLQPEPIRRALRTLDVYAHFCRRTGLGPDEIEAVATSAIRDARNGEELVARAREETGIEIRILSRREEARYGYLAAVNSTTLADGVVLDLGGGSLQLVGVRDRHATELESWPLGAVRMTERFLPDPEPSKKGRKALRAHVAEALESAPWVTGHERLVGIGGTVRNLAAAAQAEAGLPSFGVQGFVLEREALAALVEHLAGLAPSKRGTVPGIKLERGDVILAGALVVEAVLELGGFDGIEVTQEGLREGVFFERYLAPADPPLIGSVREASVRNLAAQYDADATHADHVAALALQVFDALAGAGLHDADPAERELLWAAAQLHDIGVAVDYDDHHKHSRYLILHAGLPGFDPREVALVAQMARYHRKGSPGLGELAPLARKGDDELVARGSALLRLAEQLERSRDQLVREARVAVEDGEVALELVADGDASVARWSAERTGDLFEQAFGRRLRIVD